MHDLFKNTASSSIFWGRFDIFPIFVAELSGGNRYGKTCTILFWQLALYPIKIGSSSEGSAAKLIAIVRLSEVVGGWETFVTVAPNHSHCGWGW